MIRNVEVTGEIAIGNRKKRKTGFNAIVDVKIRYCTWNSSRLLCHYRNQLKQDNDFISAFSIRLGLKIVDAVSSVIVFDGNVNCLSSGCTVDPRRPRKTKWTSVRGSIIYLFVIFPMGGKTIFVINDFCSNRRIRAKRKSCGFNTIFWNVNYPISHRNI